MEFFNFTFQSLWHFLGVIILLSIMGEILTSIFRRK